MGKAINKAARVSWSPRIRVLPIGEWIGQIRNNYRREKQTNKNKRKVTLPGFKLINPLTLTKPKDNCLSTEHTRVSF